MKNDYKADKQIGPGGIKCPCCNVVGYKNKKAKKFFNRRYRRAKKQQLAE